MGNLNLLYTKPIWALLKQPWISLVVINTKVKCIAIHTGTKAQDNMIEVSSFMIPEEMMHHGLSGMETGTHTRHTNSAVFFT